MHEVVLWLQLQGFINMKEWKKLQMSYIKNKNELQIVHTILQIKQMYTYFKQLQEFLYILA